MRCLKSGLLLSAMILSIAVTGCTALTGGNQLPNNDPIQISLNQVVGFWESQAQSVGFTGYFYRFYDNGSMELYEETPDNLVLNGSFTINGYSMHVELRNPSTNGVILDMDWELINAEQNELVFRTVPDEAIIWLKRVVQ